MTKPEAIHRLDEVGTLIGVKLTLGIAGGRWQISADGEKIGPAMAAGDVAIAIEWICKGIELAYESMQSESWQKLSENYSKIIQEMAGVQA